MFATPTERLIITTPGIKADELDETPVDQPEVPASEAWGTVVPEGSSLDNREDRTRGQVITMYRIFIEGECIELLPRSQVVWRDKVLDIRGDPEFWPGPAGEIDHTEALAALVRG